LSSTFLLVSLPYRCSGVTEYACQQISPKRWFANVNVTSFCDVTNSAYAVAMTTAGLRHCSVLEFGRGASKQAVAPGITRPLDLCQTQSASPDIRHEMFSAREIFCNDKLTKSNNFMAVIEAA